MIPTWVHGVVDYLVALLLGTLSAGGSFSPAVREVLGGAGAMHATYSALTDYEAGLFPRLTMRQHLGLDALGALGICAAGLLMRRETPRERAMLMGVGLSELLVVSLSSAAPVSGPGQRGGPAGRLSERLEALRRHAG